MKQKGLARFLMFKVFLIYFLKDSKAIMGSMKNSKLLNSICGG